MKNIDSNRIYQILGDEFKNIYIVDCEDQQIHTFKETLELPGFSSCTSYNDAMNQYIEQQFAALRYEKNILVVEETTSVGGCGSFNAASSCPASACLYDSAAWGIYIVRKEEA